jgi:hypothetical protein
MSIGVFTDKEHRPTAREIHATVNPKCEAWEELVQFIRDKYSAQEEFRFYGKNYGWAMRFRKGGKALVSLYPADGNFTVQIILSELDAKKAMALKIGKRIRQIIAEAHAYLEGRWLFIPVKSAKDIRDIQRLLALKRGTR